ncbi:MAG: TnsA endonuclease N-terminal domain-containing protein, partial [Marinomonas sp.]|uniref:Tn7 transposase TnsA N-terminal domain-containing protein n=1 Tax=Marinomonas sp. TaxID=1904862 RepID=UPI003C71A3BD
MYIRNLRKPSPNKNIYKFVSRKNRSTVMCESGLEFDACFHLEFSPSIVSFESQPTGIEYQADTKARRYTPDFKIVKNTGETEFIEIKPERIHSTQKFRDEFEYKRAGYSALGYKLILVSEKQIRNGNLLPNLKILHRYASSHLSELHYLALGYIKKAKCLSISQLAVKLGVLIGDC